MNRGNVVIIVAVVIVVVAVLVGYDNSPDKKALILKYGEKDYTRHIHEAIPHVHTKDKKLMALTEEYSFEKFYEEIKRIVQS